MVKGMPIKDTIFREVGIARSRQEEGKGCFLQSRKRGASSQGLTRPRWVIGDELLPQKEKGEYILSARLQERKHEKKKERTLRAGSIGSQSLKKGGNADSSGRDVPEGRGISQVRFKKRRPVGGGVRKMQSRARGIGEK